jgi:alpha-tubulin suppressor-like RCC1 family protein
VDGFVYILPSVREEEQPELLDHVPAETAEQRKQARQNRTKNRKTRNDITVRYLIEGLSNISAIAMGEEHILALDRNGRVWSWGNSKSGRLGHGKYDYEYNTKREFKKIRTPMMIRDLENVVQIAAGKDFSVALTSDGVVYSWGVNTVGQLGSTSMMNAKKPQVITALSGMKIVSVACGDAHCMALTDTGSVLTWGHNLWAQLGHGDTISELRKPTQLSALKGMRVSFIGTGAQHSFVLCSKT